MNRPRRTISTDEKMTCEITMYDEQFGEDAIIANITLDDDGKKYTVKLMNKYTNETFTRSFETYNRAKTYVMGYIFSYGVE